jgi:hypothetical protein
MTQALLPSVASGGKLGAQVPKTAYTLRRFTHNYLSSLHNSLTGPDGKLALDVMGRSLAHISLLDGVPALPFLDDLLDLWEMFFGTPVRSNRRKTLREAGGQVLTNVQSKPIQLSGAEAAAQAMGFRPERITQISGEHWTMENVKKRFAEKRNDLYGRVRLAKTQEERQKVVRDIQRFNMEARKYRGVFPPIAASSLRGAASQKPERPFMEFGRMLEASP